MQSFRFNLSVQHKLQNPLDSCPPILNLSLHKLPTFSLFLFFVLSPPLKSSFGDATICGKKVVSHNVFLEVSFHSDQQNAVTQAKVNSGSLSIMKPSS